MYTYNDILLKVIVIIFTGGRRRAPRRRSPDGPGGSRAPQYNI